MIYVFYIFGFLILSLIVSVIILFQKKPEIDIDKFEDGIAWYDKEGNLINSSSKIAKKKK